MMPDHLLYGVHITDRVKHATEVQKVFTEFGCSIKTRIGLHDTGDGFCSPNGLIVIEMLQNDDEARRLAEKLKAIEGVQVQQMLFQHP